MSDERKSPLTPEDLQALIEYIPQLEGRVEELEGEVETLNGQVEEKKADVEAKQVEIDKLQKSTTDQAVVKPKGKWKSLFAATALTTVLSFAAFGYVYNQKLGLEEEAGRQATLIQEKDAKISDLQRKLSEKPFVTVEVKHEQKVTDEKGPQVIFDSPIEVALINKELGTSFAINNAVRGIEKFSCGVKQGMTEKRSEKDCEHLRQTEGLPVTIIQAHLDQYPGLDLTSFAGKVAKQYAYAIVQRGPDQLRAKYVKGDKAYKELGACDPTKGKYTLAGKVQLQVGDIVTFIAKYDDLKLEECKKKRKRKKKVQKEQEEENYDLEDAVSVDPPSEVKNDEVAAPTPQDEELDKDKPTCKEGILNLTDLIGIKAVEVYIDAEKKVYAVAFGKANPRGKCYEANKPYMFNPDTYNIAYSEVKVTEKTPRRGLKAFFNEIRQKQLLSQTVVSGIVGDYARRNNTRDNVHLCAENNKTILIPIDIPIPGTKILLYKGGLAYHVSGDTVTLREADQCSKPGQPAATETESKTINNLTE